MVLFISHLLYCGVLRPSITGKTVTDFCRRKALHDAPDRGPPGSLHVVPPFGSQISSAENNICVLVDSNMSSKKLARFLVGICSLRMRSQHYDSVIYLFLGMLIRKTGRDKLLK